MTGQKEETTASALEQAAQKENEETKALEQASENKDENAKALDHIQSVLDKSEDDKEGESAAGGDPGKGDDDSETQKSEDGDGGKEPEKKPESGGDPGKGEDKGGKDGEGEANAKPEDGGKQSDDKVKALLDSGLFEEFRKEGSLTVEGWGKLMDGIEALLNEVVSGRDKLREISAFAERQKSEAFNAKIDSVFDGLGDEFADAFGKGSASKLDKAFMDNRNAVLQKAETLVLGYQAQGKDVTLEDAVKEAAGLWASQNFKRPQEKRQQDRRGQFISKPAGEKPVAARGDEAALDFIEKFKKEHND